MKQAIIKAFIFAAGAATGAAVAYKVLHNRYEERIQEEIEELDEYYANKEAVQEETVEETTEDADTDEAVNETVNDILEKEGYVRYSAVQKKEEVEEVKKPHVISNREFGEDEEYDTETLTYYADGVLVDDADNVIQDVEAVVGKESLTHFGENEHDPDTVYVKNENYKKYYEILFDESDYNDVYGYSEDK